METQAPSKPLVVEGPRVSKRWMVWTGSFVSAIPIAMLLFSATMKLSHQQQVVEMWSGMFGYPESTLVVIGVIELLCAVLYAIPRTSVLGAILVTGYLGGATATHVRIADPYIIPIALGVLAWLGLYLRDGRLRSLLPLRRAVAAKA